MAIVLKVANIEVRDNKGEPITVVPINVDSAQLFIESVKRLGGQAEVVSVIDEVRDDQ